MRREHGETIIPLVPIARHEYELSVQDNGVGIARDVNCELPQSLGLDLVRIFVQQLRGTVQFHTDHGTEVVVRFKDIRRAKKP